MVEITKSRGKGWKPFVQGRKYSWPRQGVKTLLLCRVVIMDSRGKESEPFVQGTSIRSRGWNLAFVQSTNYSLPRKGFETFCSWKKYSQLSQGL